MRGPCVRNHRRRREGPGTLTFQDPLVVARQSRGARPGDCCGHGWTQTEHLAEVQEAWFRVGTGENERSLGDAGRLGGLPSSCTKAEETV